jgi:uncharacterized protein (DUF1800 family)
MTARGRLALLAVTALVLGACATRPVGPAARPSASTPAKAPAAPTVALPTSALTEDEQILHVLSRLGYGPRPGDVERVRRQGLGRWIAAQLRPESIPDEAVGQALAAYRTLGMSAADLAREYPVPPPTVRRDVREGDMSPREMREAYPPERRPYAITAELQSAKVIRAIASERQLQEVMVDFWFNHFNVFAQKGAVRWMISAYEREAIRPHAMGRFRDLVVATARHPAMLFYLDNWLSTRADFTPLAGPARGRRLGLNENYARELMELHTLGVDGGYTQEDVIEVARCFTGWTINRPDQGGGFVYRPQTHDGGAKRVLGHTIPAGGGERDGLEVIDLLVRHPSTARFVATKLVRRFVSDDPSPALVERVTRTFRDTDGDVRAMLVTIVTAPEFLSEAAYRAKIKKPLEVVASAARALDVRLAPPATAGGSGLFGGGYSLARQVAQLGEPLYEAQPPTGHPDVAEAWVNTGALLARMNFALGLTQNRYPGVKVDLTTALGAVDRGRPEAVLDRVLALALNGRVTSETTAVLRAQLDSPEIRRATSDDRGPANTDVEKLVALVLGAPEFQRR